MKILFYSNKCKYCYKILLLIKQKNINLKYVCIDNNFDIPKNIKKVPTLIVHNIPKPLEGKEIINWINNINFFNIKTNNIMINNNIEIPNIKNVNFKGKIIDENYAFIKDDAKFNDKYHKN